MHAFQLSRRPTLAPSTAMLPGKVLPLGTRSETVTLTSINRPFNYVFSTYQDEYKRTAKRDGDSLFSTGKAIFSTELRIAFESLHYIADFFGPRKDRAVDDYEKLKSTGNQKAQQAKKVAGEKKEQLANGNAS